MKKFINLSVIFFFIVSCTKETASNTPSQASSGKGGSLAKFTIAGNYLYLVSTAGMQVFDITNSASPTLKNTISITWMAETVFAYNDNLFIGTMNGMLIYSIADPANPKELGEAAHFRSCDPVVANDTIAFVTLRGGTRCGPVTDGLYIHNIKNITQPVLIKTVEMQTPIGLGLNDSILYVCQYQNGLSIYNVQNPSSPLLRKQITGSSFKDVIVYGKLLVCYVESGIELYDISTPSDPQFINAVTE